MHRHEYLTLLFFFFLSENGVNQQREHGWKPKPKYCLNWCGVVQAVSFMKNAL